MKKLLFLFTIPCILLLSWCANENIRDIPEIEKKDFFSRNVECNRLAKNVEDWQCENAEEHTCYIDDINYNEKYKTCFGRIKFNNDWFTIVSTSYFDLVTRIEMISKMCTNFWEKEDFSKCLDELRQMENERFKEYWNYHNY